MIGQFNFTAPEEIAAHHPAEKNVGRITAAALAGRRSLISGDGFTRNQRREIERRRKALVAFDALTEKGITKAAAAKELRLSPTTLWRWRGRIEPLTPNCGRKTTLEKFAVPAAILAKVRKLQLSGKSNADAWHEIADDPQCPGSLAAQLRSTRNISPSLLAATRLIKRTVKIIESPEFSVIINPRTTNHHDHSKRTDAHQFRP